MREHTKNIEHRHGLTIAHCSACPWEYRGSHQEILVAWWGHLQNIGTQETL